MHGKVASLQTFFEVSKHNFCKIIRFSDMFNRGLFFINFREIKYNKINDKIANLLFAYYFAILERLKKSLDLKFDF